MDQLGHLLLGLALAWPTFSILRAMVQASRRSCLPAPSVSASHQQRRALPVCDPEAAAEYFASLLPRPKAETGQTLSLAEFREMLRITGPTSPKGAVRFDGEGGYQLRL